CPGCSDTENGSVTLVIFASIGDSGFDVYNVSYCSTPGLGEVARIVLSGIPNDVTLYQYVFPLTKFESTKTETNPTLGGNSSVKSYSLRRVKLLNVPAGSSLL